MSEQNQRRLRFMTRSVLALAIVAGIVMLLVPSPSVSPARAQVADAEPLDPAVYSAVQALRRNLALSNRDLAAIGLSQEQAESVLSAVVEWCETNRQSVIESRAAVRLAERSLRDANRRYMQGPRDEALIATLPRLHNAVASAESARDSVVAGAVSTVTAQLTGEQSSLWSTARANIGRPAGLRFAANVTDEQAKSYELSLRKARRFGESTGNVSSRVLSVSQQAEIRASATRINANMAGVLAAETEVLPISVDSEGGSGVNEP